MSSDVKFTVNNYQYSLNVSGGVLTDYRYFPKQPVLKFVEIPGRSEPLDISLAATGSMQYTSARHEMDCTFYKWSALGYSNDYYASTFMNNVNGKRALVEVNNESFTAEVSVADFQYLGDCVMVTFDCTEVTIS